MCTSFVDSSVRFSRHLGDGMTRSNTFALDLPPGYTHNCLCGGNHGQSNFTLKTTQHQVPMIMGVQRANTCNPSPCPGDHHYNCFCSQPPQSGIPEEHRPQANATSVRWNKASMLRHINQAQKNELAAKHKLWATNRFGKRTPGLDSFRFGGRHFPKKYLKYPHDTHHGYCPVHPESQCVCEKCGGGEDGGWLPCTCDKRDIQGWHNEGFGYNKRDRLPLSARTASEQTHKNKSKRSSRRPFVPRGDRTYDPPVHSTFAGSRTTPGMQSGQGWAAFTV